MDDDLLRRFAQNGDTKAFTELVQRHIQLVYAAARRQTRDEHFAHDITQAVFVTLASKARSIASAAMLPGWLIKTTRLTALSEMRKQSRRRNHEAKAGSMSNEEFHPPEANQLEIRDFLDDALLKLSAADRSVVTMTYLQGRPIAEVAALLGVSPSAAERRAHRAIEKLRASLRRRGVVAPAAAIVTLLAVEATAHAATASAIAGAIATSALTAASAATTVGLVATIKGTAMAFATKKALAVIAACLLLGFGILAVIRFTPNDRAERLAAAPRPIALAGAPSAPIVAEPAATLAAAPPTPGTKIKVGLLAIHLKDRADKPGGVTRLAIVKQLPAETFEVHAIVDWAVTDNDMMQVADREKLIPANPIDIADPHALDSLDVIIASREWNLTMDAIGSIHHAVESGVGLLNQTPIAMNAPGLDDPQVLDLHGMREASYFYLASFHGPALCNVIADHELLRGLDGKTVITPGLNGVIGTFTGTPLIASLAMHNENGPRNSVDVSKVGKNPPVDPARPDAAFYLLYTASLGKGRIVGCQWYKPEPLDALKRMKGESFYPRCVRWLAEGHAKAMQSPSTTQPVSAAP